MAQEHKGDMTPAIVEQLDHKDVSVKTNDYLLHKKTNGICVEDDSPSMTDVKNEHFKSALDFGNNGSGDRYSSVNHIPTLHADQIAMQADSSDFHQDNIYQCGGGDHSSSRHNGWSTIQSSVRPVATEGVIAFHALLPQQTQIDEDEMMADQSPNQFDGSYPPAGSPYYMQNYENVPINGISKKSPASEVDTSLTIPYSQSQLNPPNSNSLSSPVSYEAGDISDCYSQSSPNHNNQKFLEKFYKKTVQEYNSKYLTENADNSSTDLVTTSILKNFDNILSCPVSVDNISTDSPHKLYSILKSPRQDNVVKRVCEQPIPVTETTPIHNSSLCEDTAIALIKNHKQNTEEAIKVTRHNVEQLEKDLKEDKQFMLDYMAQIMVSHVKSNYNYLNDWVSEMVDQAEVALVGSELSLNKNSFNNLEQFYHNEIVEKKTLNEPASKTTGIVSRDLQRVLHKIDPDITDESSSDDDEDSYDHKINNSNLQHQTSGFESCNLVENKQVQQNSSSVGISKKHSTLNYLNTRVKTGSSSVWLSSKVAHLNTQISQLENLQNKLRRQKAQVVLDDVLITPSTTTKDTLCSNDDDKESTSEETATKSNLFLSNDDPTQVCARARPLKYNLKSRKIFYPLLLLSKRKAISISLKKQTASIDNPLYNSTPYHRCDGKNLDLSRLPISDLLQKFGHPCLQNLNSPIYLNLETCVNSFMASDSSWYKNYPVNIEKRSKNEHRNSRNSKWQQQRRLDVEGTTSKKRKSISNNQFSSDSKRLRTTSGDCYELEAAATVSGASTPTHVDYSPLQRRKRNVDGSISSEANKIQSAKDIQIPSWRVVDSDDEDDDEDDLSTSIMKEILDEIELEKLDQTYNRYCSRHDHYEMLEKKKFLEQLKANRKKNGGRVGSRANLTSTSEVCPTEVESVSSPSNCGGSSGKLEDTLCAPVNSPRLSAEGHTPHRTNFSKPSTNQHEPSTHPSHLPQPAPTPPTSISSCWKQRVFPLTDEEVLRLTQIVDNPPMDHEPSRAQYITPVGRYAHLNNFKILRVDTNTAPKYSNKATTRRKKRSKAKKEPMRRRRKSSFRDWTEDEKISSDEKTCSDYDSELTLTASESDMEPWTDPDFVTFPSCRVAKLHSSSASPSRYRDLGFRHNSPVYNEKRYTSKGFRCK